MSSTTAPATFEPGAGARSIERVPVQERYYAWQWPVRISHWLIALSIAVLSATGFYLGHPFIVVAGEPRFHFVMGTVKAVHFYTAIVFTLSVLSRILWMFLGNSLSRWDQFIPIRAERRRDLVKTLRFYLFIDRSIPEQGGHNPLAGLAYSAVFGLYLVEIATGLALYSVSAHIGSPLAVFDALLPWLGGAQTARWIHHVVMWLLLAFAVHHVYSAWLVSIVEKNGTMDSIFSGYKFRSRTGGSDEEPR